MKSLSTVASIRRRKKGGLLLIISSQAKQLESIPASKHIRGRGKLSKTVSLQNQRNVNLPKMKSVVRCSSLPQHSIIDSRASHDAAVADFQTFHVEYESLPTKLAAIEERFKILGNNLKNASGDRRIELEAELRKLYKQEDPIYIRIQERSTELSSYLIKLRKAIMSYRDKQRPVQ